MRSSGRASVGLLLGIAFLFAGCGKPATPPTSGGTTSGGATAAKPAGGQPESGGATTANAEAKPAAQAADDVRGLVPDDAQIAVAFQPQKVWQSKLVTKLVPEKFRTDFLTNAKRNLPVDPESISKVVVLYSPVPAGFPAKKVDQDPTAYFTGIIQFNDSLKMSDRLKKLLEKSPFNTLKGMSGEAWWGSRKDLEPDDTPQKRRGYFAAKAGDGKMTYQEMDEQGKVIREITEEEMNAENQKFRDQMDARRKRLSTPNQRLSETPDAFDIVLFAPNDKTLIVGLKSRIEGVSKGSGTSDLKDVLKDADFAHDLIIAGAKLDEFKPPQKALQELSRDPGVAMPMMMAMDALTKFKQTLLQIGVSPGANLIDIRLTTKDEATAEQLEKQLEQGKQTGKAMAGPVVAGPDANANSPGKQALDEIEKNWKVTRAGAQLRLSVAHTEKLNQLTIDAVQPILATMQGAAARTEDRNNVRQIGLAIHNFASAYNKMPPGGGKGDYRETLPTDKQVGWLYDLLPFMEQANVHTAIKKDKPWDDAANKQSGATVIPAYINSETPLEMLNGYAPTHIVGIGGLGENGPNEPLDSKKAGAFAFNRLTKFGSFHDGLSNTIVSAQAYKNFGPWIANTKATIRPFTQKPYLHGPDGIGGPGKSGTTIVLMGDGSVRTLPDSTDPSVIEAMSTINGGEAVPADR